MCIQLSRSIDRSIDRSVQCMYIHSAQLIERSIGPTGTVRVFIELSPIDQIESIDKAHGMIHSAQPIDRQSARHSFSSGDRSAKCMTFIQLK
jgi:hypothetical protein